LTELRFEVLMAVKMLTVVFWAEMCVILSVITSALEEHTASTFRVKMEVTMFIFSVKVRAI
jgi:hypothetical protein